MSLESLYQEIILDHAKRRIGFGLVREEGDGATSHQRNPICGDEITLRAYVENGMLRAVEWDGHGCSISQASASMLADLMARDPHGEPRVDGMPRAAASELIAAFREALRSRGTIELDEEQFGDAAALSGVSKYTARVKCAMLAWVALEDALTRA